jgi:hypothetical protein
VMSGMRAEQPVRSIVVLTLTTDVIRSNTILKTQFYIG